MLEEAHILKAKERNLVLWLLHSYYGANPSSTHKTHLMDDLGNEWIFALEACFSAVPARRSSFLTLLGWFQQRPYMVYNASRLP